MIDNPNTLIEQVLADFTVGGVEIPVSFLRYIGNETTYITYQQTDATSSLFGDDDLENYVDFYDFDIYSLGNYIPIVEALKIKLKDAGFVWHPSRSSGDMYEDDTKLYHKVLSFSIERSTQNG